MRTRIVLLLILVVCAVAFSKDLRKRRSYIGDDAAALDAFVKAIEDGKIALNGLLNDDTKNPNRRILWNYPNYPWGKK